MHLCWQEPTRELGRQLGYGPRGRREKKKEAKTPREMEKNRMRWRKSEIWKNRLTENREMSKKRQKETQWGHKDLGRAFNVSRRRDAQFTGASMEGVYQKKSVGLGTGVQDGAQQAASCEEQGATRH